MGDLGLTTDAMNFTRNPKKTMDDKKGVINDGATAVTLSKQGNPGHECLEENRMEELTKGLSKTLKDAVTGTYPVCGTHSGYDNSMPTPKYDALKAKVRGK